MLFPLFPLSDVKINKLNNPNKLIKHDYPVMDHAEGLNSVSDRHFKRMVKVIVKLVLMDNVQTLDLKFQPVLNLYRFSI